MKYIIFILVLLLATPLTALADAPQPMIGPIQAEGATASDEFVILINPNDQNIDIGSWSIQYKSSGGATFYKKNFNKGAFIPAAGTYVVCGKDFAGPCDMKHSSFSLSSAGGTVFLVSNQTLITSPDSTDIIDQKTYSATDTGTNSNANGNTNVNANTNSPIDAKPAAPAKQPDILALVINEFMPAAVELSSTPREGKEWIELYNGTGYAIELAGWTIADGTGKNISSLEGLIQPSGFKLVELAASRLNDGGDLISLRNAENKEVDSVAYGAWNDGLPAAAVELSSTPSGSDGIAIARIADGRDTNDDANDFSLTTSPTPGTRNIIVSPIVNDKELTTKSQGKSQELKSKIQTDTKWLADLLSQQNDEIAKLLKADNIIIINNLNISTDVNSKFQEPNSKTTTVKTTAKTASATAASTKTTTVKTTAAKTTSVKPANVASGMVIVPAGVVGKDICVVREENRSVEVRLPPTPKQMPVAGDIVTASGAWSTAKTLTLPRLLVRTTAAFAITDHDTPPEPVSIPMSKINEHIGEIVLTSGTVVEKQSTKIRIADGGSESLLIKSDLAAVKGDKISATGLLVKNSTDTLLTALAPDALSIIKPPSVTAPSLAQKALPYGIAVIPAGILAGSVYIGKRIKKKKSPNDE